MAKQPKYNIEQDLPVNKREGSLKTKSAIGRNFRDIMIDGMQELYKEAMANTKTVYKNTNVSVANSKKSCIINIFDSHFGETIKSANKDGIHSIVYSFDIATKRMNAVFDEAIRIMNETKKTNYDEVFVVLGGDHIDGDGTVYPHQVHEIEEGFLSQLVQFQRAMITNIHKLSEFMGKDGKLIIVGVPGNHGMNKRNSTFHPILDNYDTGIYMHLWAYIEQIKSMYNKLQNVELYFPTNVEYVNFMVKGWKIQARHKLPKNFNTPSVKVLVHGWREMHEIDMLLTGHFHDSALATIGKTKVVRVGCLPGGNDFAEHLGLFGESEQTIIITSKDKLIEQYIPVNLSKIK